MIPTYHPYRPDIMVVDDNTANLNVLAAVLKNGGYAVRAASVPEMALQSALDHPPALLLLDIRMPGMDGFEVCRQLKQDTRTANVPVIFISGHGELADRVHGFQLGAVDFISKPFQQDEVLARVRAHLALREAQDTLEQRVRERTEELEERNRLLSLSEARARELSTLLRLISDNVPDMIWAKDRNNRYLFTNKAICARLLNAVDVLEPVGKDETYFAMRERNRHPQDPDWFTFGELCQHDDQRVLESAQSVQCAEYGNVRGKFMYLDVHKAPLVNEQGEVIGLVGSARDVTEQKAAEEKLRIASLVLENSSEGMFVTDPNDLIVEVNPAFTRLTGYEAAEAIGKTPRILKSGRHTPDFYRAIWTELLATGHWQGEIWNMRKNGEFYAEWQTINTVYDADGAVLWRVALFSDITEKKKAEELIWSQANFDTLTSLPNRCMFRDRLTQDIKVASRKGLKLALMFIDLDHFKEINDTLGHDQGDILLVEAAKRISACVRDTDTVARLGGDEFTVVLSELEDIGRIQHIAENIIQSLAQPFHLNKEKCYISASIGITLYPDDATEPEDLLKNADQAMFTSKRAGRNRYCYFTGGMQQESQRRMQLINELHVAVQEKQFVLHYQPIITQQSGRIQKAEALIRWMHPQRGMTGPAEFIAAAEDSGLINEIGDWVFLEAAKQIRHWQSIFGTDFQLSLNISPVQIHGKDFHLSWLNQMQAMGLSGSSFVFEITEGLLLEHSSNVSGRLLALHDAGIQVAIDDFGTGYSALSYLKKLDIDYLKIDKSFIHNLSTDPDDKALAEAIIVMAHKLGLKVIAEGVETPEQEGILAGFGCDYVQGYFHSKPLSAEQFEAWVKERNAHAIAGR